MISLEKILLYVRVQCFHKIPRYFLLGSGDCLSYLIVGETCRHKKNTKKGGECAKKMFGLRFDEKLDPDPLRSV